jgi:uncharacterized OB-fold protein
VEDTISRLTAVKCQNCGKVYIPPKYICPECESTEFTDITLSGKGKVLTYTTIRVPPLGFEEQAPYHIAIILLDEGINVPARISNGEGKTPKIEDEVSFVKKEGGAYWFRLAG